MICGEMYACWTPFDTKYCKLPSELSDPIRVNKYWGSIPAHDISVKLLCNRVHILFAQYANFKVFCKGTNSYHHALAAISAWAKLYNKTNALHCKAVQ